MSTGEFDKPEDETGEPSIDDERPTVSPPEGPTAYARKAFTPDGASDAHSRLTPIGTRAPYPTRHDSDELEAARRASMEGTGERPAAGRRPPSSASHPPAGLLSLANARVPSNLPPRHTTAHAPSRRESPASALRMEEKWLTLATAPPPSSLTEEDFYEEAEGATKPPPASAQALIDEMTRSQETAPAAENESRRRNDDEPSGVSLPGIPTAREMNDKISLGDYSGALEIAEKLLVLDPSDVGVRATLETCRSVLRQMYAARIGPLERVPVVMVPRDQLRWLSIDHRAGFVLSLVDGVSTLEMILDVSGMPELDALRILADLAQQRVIAFR